MKGTLTKNSEGVWMVKWSDLHSFAHGTHWMYTELIDNGHIDGLKLYDSNEGLEVDFEMVAGYDNNGPEHFPKYAKIITPEEAELKDWDVTLNDGLEDEPYVSDDFQIGPDGAYEHTEDWTEELEEQYWKEQCLKPFATPEELERDGAYEHIEDTTLREKAKSELINLLLYQIMDLTTMSKIELGDDVIAEIKRLKDIIKIGEHEIEKAMTPREKASELVDKFSNKCLLTTDGGKVAALIAVDEIKRILYDQDSMIRYDYWFEVKQEIEKL
jgi:hypothetical protein